MCFFLLLFLLFLLLCYFWQKVLAKRECMSCGVLTVVHLSHEINLCANLGVCTERGVKSLEKMSWWKWKYILWSLLTARSFLFINNLNTYFHFRAKWLQKKKKKNSLVVSFSDLHWLCLEIMNLAQTKVSHLPYVKPGL